MWMQTGGSTATWESHLKSIAIGRSYAVAQNIHFDALLAGASLLAGGRITIMPPEDDPARYHYLYEPSPCDPRYCRTHAMVADLFAKSSAYSANAAAWAFNANAWTELAELKERTKENTAFPVG